MRNEYPISTCILLFLLAIMIGMLLGSSIGKPKAFRDGYNWAHSVDVCYSIRAKPLKQLLPETESDLLFRNSIVCQKRNTLYVFRGRPRHYKLITQFEIEENKERK